MKSIEKKKAFSLRTFLTVAVLASSLLAPPLAFSEAEDAIAQEEVASEAVKDRPEWLAGIKTQYKLTDAQVQTLKDSGISYPQMAMTAGLADKSGKSIDEVLKMRTESKMGWGKIAKELGVAPKEIGQSVASLRHEIRAEKMERKLERKEAKLERKLEKKNEKREQKNSHKNH